MWTGEPSQAGPTQFEMMVSGPYEDSLMEMSEQFAEPPPHFSNITIPQNSYPIGLASPMHGYGGPPGYMDMGFGGSMDMGYDTGYQEQFFTPQYESAAVEQQHFDLVSKYFN